MYWILGFGLSAFVAAVFTSFAYLLEVPVGLDPTITMPILFLVNVMFGLAALRAPRPAVVIGTLLVTGIALIAWQMGKLNDMSGLFPFFSLGLTLMCVGVAAEELRKKKA